MHQRDARHPAQIKPKICVAAALRPVADVIVSVHAPFDVLDFDGPPIGVEMPARFGRLQLNRIGVYPGSLGNFGGVKEGIPVVTLELPHALDAYGGGALARLARHAGMAQGQSGGTRVCE